MPILFLDFDGVLHPEHCHESKHFCCLPVLEDALRQAPEWQVVISSTWRLQKSLAGR
ncbi:HAD domain-containing protein [Acidovorax temperans]|uniref:HAD domain-containing protein n=1 Tax=Acidovorax temperans TaxID=80878 RepID=UPI002358E5A2|nr:HAD domain-containing protein [Acidovorax temperans]WCT24267.1 HAD domain-containing protein [Acidovorax temperans]